MCCPRDVSTAGEFACDEPADAIAVSRVRIKTFPARGTLGFIPLIPKIVDASNFQKRDELNYLKSEIL